MMESVDSIPISSLSLSTTTTTTTTTPSPTSLSAQSQTPEQRSIIMRQWRPAAQRNLRNQWSKLAALRQDWVSCSLDGRAHATSLVNSFLSQKYMDVMDLGVLSDMPNIRNKACYKLQKQQELYRCGILSSYKRMVSVVVHMINASQSMKCFLQGTKGYSLLQFSTSTDDKNDPGDGGGIPVFTFLSVPAFEKLAVELVEMFKWELIMKRLLVVELLCASCVKTELTNGLSWSDELYQGETHDLSICNLYAKETSEPVIPRVQSWGCDADAIRSGNQPDREVLQVYLTTWLVEVNIDTHRADEIFGIVGEEMHTSF